MHIPENSALIVVDLQIDFITGSLAVPDAEKVIDPISELCNEKGWLIVLATKDWHPKNHCSFASNWKQKPFCLKSFSHPNDSSILKEQVLWPDHCVQESKGSEFPEEFSEVVADLKMPVVKKGYLVDREYYSAFEDVWGLHKTELNQILEEKFIKNVYVVGLAYDYCVLNTSISSSKLNYNTYVIKDLSTSVYPDKNNETDEVYKSNNVKIIELKDIS